MFGGSAVMNVIGKAPGRWENGVGRTALLPHPFDILAIFALYQTVPDPP